MTNVGTIILLVVCVGVGFVLEPLMMSLREDRKADATETKKEPEPEKKREPALPPTPEFELDLRMVTAEFFPEKVSLKETISIGYVDRDGNNAYKDLKPGTEVKPLRLEGNDLVYETLGTVLLESKIHVDKTNFKELVIPVIMERLRNPETAKEPEPEPEPVFLEATAILAVIKDSVEAGKVTEFKAEQVTEWAVGADLEFDGQMYQTGLVTFEAQTILGTQQQKAIALIKNGELARWVWAKTKLEMR